MLLMPDIRPLHPPGPSAAWPTPTSTALADLDPFLATQLGIRPDDDRLPDLSPAGQQAMDDLHRSTLAALRRPPGPPPTATSAAAPGCCASGWSPSWPISAAGEHLREVSKFFGPLQAVRGVFMMMPTRAPPTTGR